ncbi:MAG TPA: hypothetical protein RMH99_04075 [Sandaracinaceae bacterium LLY-WYZ-13_1]|nr:hypothetical protein [Sandaracinaceae bacterium LLY-WYZ-13_1]
MALPALRLDPPLETRINERASLRGLRLLARMEELPEDSVGAFVFTKGSVREGALLVEHGRVCWAAAARMTHRLTDLLVDRSDGRLSRRRLQEVFVRCRQGGRPLGEALVSEGLVSSERLRDALVTHTTESLFTLGDLDELGAQWVPRASASYDARFTFTSTELAVAMAERLCAPVARRAREALVRILPEGALGAAFDRDTGASIALPVAVVRGEALGVRGLEQLARWAAHTMDLSGAFTRPRSVMARGDDGVTWLAWRTDDLLFVALCERAADAAMALGRLTRAGG